jgi:hypothetical protein
MAVPQTTPPACTKCGINLRRMNHWGEPDDLCDACEKARIEDGKRVADHHEKHPDDCCCGTYLGRPCCMAPSHGDRWRVNAVSDGERFCYIIRAQDRKEAMEVGRNMCEGNGEECISVARMIPDLCLQCQKECGQQYWRLNSIRGHFCSQQCCQTYLDVWKKTHGR